MAHEDVHHCMPCDPFEDGSAHCALPEEGCPTWRPKARIYPPQGVRRVRFTSYLPWCSHPTMEARPLRRALMGPRVPPVRPLLVEEAQLCVACADKGAPSRTRKAGAHVPRPGRDLVLARHVPDLCGSELIPPNAATHRRPVAVARPDLPAQQPPLGLGAMAMSAHSGRGRNWVYQSHRP